MDNMKNLLLITILSVLVGCNISQKEEIKLFKGKAIITGKVSNFENKLKIIGFSGKTIIGDIVQNEIIDSLGYFRTEFELFHPQDVSISYENGWANLYLKPNDSLFIEFDPS
ncbi:MAG: hypothetical protein ABFS12_18535, partial [Bacteroidota bacterium]